MKMKKYTKEWWVAHERKNAPRTYTSEEVEMELFGLLERVAGDLGTYVNGRDIVSFLEGMKEEGHYRKFPRWKDLVESSIEDIKENYGLEEEYA
jgi:hypothetical protein